MAKHRRYHHRRRNPFGLSPGVFRDAAYTAAGALGSIALTSLVPSFNTGWTGVAATGVAAVAASFIGKMIGGAAIADELLKGGLAATVIRGVHQAGIFKSVQLAGMGIYAPSYFTVPTVSDAYGRTPFPALPAAAKAAMSGMGRYRSRYLQ